MNRTIGRRGGALALAAASLTSGAMLRVPVANAASGSSTISGVVFDDANRNGVQDAGEAPFSGKLIELYASSGAWVNSVMSGSAGRYAFGGLADGTYSVRFDMSE